MVATPTRTDRRDRIQRRYLDQGHIVQWRTASALWRQRAEAKADLKEPAILRFASDRFMEEFMAVAQQAPQRLGEWQAQYETWRQLAPTPSLRLPPSDPPKDSGRTLKLYQPAHQRYYLITASLVCRQPGLPDKALNLGQKEKVSFVVRRMLRPEGSTIPVEHVWVDGGWQPADVPNQLTAGEETFPMFPTTYREANDYQRRLFAGLVPVTERERYLTAPRRSQSVSVDAPPDLEDKIDRLVTLFNIDVLAPWRELLRQVGNPFPLPDDQEPIPTTDVAQNEGLTNFLGPLTQTIWDSLKEDGATDNLRDTVILQRDQLQMPSWYALVDFADFLKTYLPRVWAAITPTTADDEPLAPGSDQQALYEALATTRFRPGIESSASQRRFYELLVGRIPTTASTSLVDALQDVSQETTRNFLETTTITYNAVAAAQANSNSEDDQNWPELPFLLCGRDMRPLVARLELLIRDALREVLDADPDSIGALPQTPLAREVSRSARPSDVADNQFLIRCVYQRPNCPASIHPTVVSDPTERFELAAYYDPDAPARPIRIPMPVDTTPAGLRKYAKNTMFVISDTLGCQIERARSITFGDLVRSVLPWPLHKDLDTGGASCNTSGSLDFGKLCTLSIPIITICALIVLMIFVLLLDIIFRWVPYLIFCLPIPGLKAKGDE